MVVLLMLDMVVRLIILCLNMLGPVSKSLCIFSRNLSLGKTTLLLTSWKLSSITASWSGVSEMDGKVSCNEEFENVSSKLLDGTGEGGKMFEEVSLTTELPLGRHIALDRRGDCFSRLLLRQRLPRSFNILRSSFLHSDDAGMFPWDGAVAVDGDWHCCLATALLERVFISSAAQSCLRKALFLLGREQLLVRKSFLTRTGVWFATVGNLVSHLIKAVL
jgi:hypothetical protein